MLTYSIAEIAEATGAVVAGNADGLFISNILIDSRQLTFGAQTLFFAIKTDRNDGHRYIPQLLAEGVKAFVVSSLYQEPENARGCVFLKVADQVAALQQLARYHRRKFQIPVVGITGSNGKTIVKEWLVQLLSPFQRVASSPKSYNSQLGVPLSIWTLNPVNTLAVFEAGISMPGEMEKLESMISPDLGIITNIGNAHAVNFSSIDQKLSEKLKLFANSHTIIYCRDHHNIHNQITTTEPYRSKKLVTWGTGEECNLRVEHIVKTPHGATISYKLRDASAQPVSRRFSIPFSDNASVENSLHCVTLMHVMGYPADAAERAMQQLTSVEMRLELREGINNCSLINDSYSNDINSLVVALDFLNQQKQHNIRSVIMSDIQQSNRPEEELYTEISKLLKAREINFFFGIGEALCRNRGLFGQQAEFFSNTEEFLHRLTRQPLVSQTILIKGARTFGFERITARLQQKNHETVLETNLTALIHNLNFYRSKLKPDVKTVAMVKAFSYGSGSFEIANVLQYHHIDYLAVAYADEGFELRKAGIRTPVMVMNPENTTALSLMAYQLEPEVYSFTQFKKLLQPLCEGATTSHPLPVHLKIETGMNRLGVDETELEQVLDFAATKSHLVRIASVFSHLAAADDPALDPFTQSQISRFEKAVTHITHRLGYTPIRHLLNSAGISRFPEAQYDMVRLGIGLYGIAPDPVDQPLLQNVNTLRSHLSQIKNIAQGESVGYNRRFVASRPSRIGVVPVGYADGITRSLGNGRFSVRINGTMAPLVGNVCMDMCMVDLTDLTEARENDPVVFFDEADSIKKMAEVMDTIPYEVLTGISRRVKRVYFDA